MLSNQKVFLVLALLAVSIHSFECKLSMGEKLAALRQYMQSVNIDAVIVPSGDEHISEYTSEYDARRAWISDFTGSSGEVAVTMTEAALWTDSRYWTEADQVLDKNFWKLMKSGETGVLSIDNWLKTKSIKKVAQNAKFTSISTWQSRSSNFKASDIDLVNPDTDLIDAVWPASERPAKPKTDISIYELKYAGKAWNEKVADVQRRIANENADMFVVTSLDDIAWLFNLRANDIPFNPMVLAYGIVHKNEQPVIYIDNTRLTPDLRTYLTGATIKEYNQIYQDLKDFKNKRIWVSPMSSYAIFSAVDTVTNQNVVLNTRASPIRSLKAVKNPIEIENIRLCQMKDSAARIRHMHWLETEIAKGTVITEKSAAEQLEKFQADGENFKGKSFSTISAVGPNAAVVHYSTPDGDNSQLTKDKLYLLDAGGQYLDCTTDITRTHHFGEPTGEEIFAYTKVFQGSTNLADAVFPSGVYGREIDIEARKPLWAYGLDYGHGTGHGIGQYSSIHESPPSISYNSRSQYDEPFAIGMISSDEPGFYHVGLFGIRLETDIEVIEAKLPFKFGNKTYLKFDTLTLVPFEPKLIDKCVLTDKQVDWINAYNNRIREKVSPMLSQYPDVQKYLETKLTPFAYSHTIQACTTPKSGASSTLSFTMIVPIGAFFLGLLSRVLV